MTTPRMRMLTPAALGLACAMLLGGCASAPAPPGAQADETRIAAVAVPGQGTRASVLAALGKTHKVVFDSGYETWLYQVPRRDGAFAEYVILFAPSGVVSKTRLREPLPGDKAANNKGH